MTNKSCISKTVEISVDRHNQLVASDATLENIKRLVVNGRFSVRDSDLIYALNCILQDPESKDNANEQA